MKLKDLLIYLSAYAITHSGEDLDVEFEADGKTWKVGGLKIEMGSLVENFDRMGSKTWKPVTPTKITLTP